MAGESTGQRQLLAFEQIGQGRGIKFRDADVAREGEGGIRHDGVFDPGEEVRHLHFDVLLRQDVLAEGARLFGDFIEQVRVHVMADAEAEDPRVADAAALHLLHDLVLAGDTDRRQTVGEENDHKRAV